MLLGPLLYVSTARADCDEGVAACCPAQPFITGTVIDSGPDARALAVDFVSPGAASKVGDAVPLVETGTPVGARAVAREISGRACRPSQPCPYGFVVQQLDGGSHTCTFATPGSPSVTLSEAEYIATAAAPNCIEAVKAKLGLEGEDLCDGANDHNRSCLCASTLVEEPTGRAVAPPLAVGLGLTCIAFLRARSRRSRALSMGER